MLYSQTNIRDNIRNRDGSRVFYLKKGDQLTSAARDYLTRERIAIVPAEEAKKERWQLLTGGWVEEKPEHLTHLNGDLLVRKDHPRIRFRGKLDTLESEVILCQLECPELKKSLGELLSLSREIMACDVLEKPLPTQSLRGMTEEELRRRSHFPQDYYGQPHFMPQCSDGPVIARLNRLRALVRETELAAVAAFQNREGQPTRTDFLRALNRMSSLIYILMIEQKVKL